MKNIFLLLITCLVSMGAFAQRQCGTMDYLELRKQHDPSLEKRMNDVEKAINDWSIAHPISSVAPVLYPSIQGFTPTGNDATDRLAYANAKQQYMLQHPVHKAKSTLTSDGYFLRLEKRKTNSFITK